MSNMYVHNITTTEKPPVRAAFPAVLAVAALSVGVLTQPALMSNERVYEQIIKNPATNASSFWVGSTEDGGVVPAVDIGVELAPGDTLTLFCSTTLSVYNPDAGGQNLQYAMTVSRKDEL